MACIYICFNMSVNPQLFFSLQPTQVIVAMFCGFESHFPAINTGNSTEFLSLVT